MKYSSLFIVVVSVSLLGALSLFYAYPKTPEKWSCTSKFSVSRMGYFFDSVVKFYFSRGQGVVVISGRLGELGSPPEYVMNRKVFYDYTADGDVLNLISSSVMISEIDTASDILLSKVLPRFFFENGVVYNLGIYKQGGGYILSGTVIPMFYCE